MSNTALITGASSGIGLELARIHGSRGGNLILVARNKMKLDELKSELEAKYKICVHVISKDLSDVDAAQEVFNEVKKQNVHVDYLINNAGYGDYGLFAETNDEKETRMIFLNIHTLTRLTKLFLPEMISRGQGKIMNLGSTASFQPVPLMGVYAATKAYVLSFSEALNNELEGTGVTVTALCPGLTESGFVDAAAMNQSKMAKQKKLPGAKEVAEFGYQAMLKGKAVVVHGYGNRLLTIAQGLVPRGLVVNMTRKLIEAR
ncbi:MAG TPA: SDR family oxidoreductase [Bacteroidales bacterium]|nr:SDR family oxidoreductase [Bacteroidales bacterium]HQI69987.1 SDR family oxidoreductase [Bacteroidales bacterium]